MTQKEHKSKVAIVVDSAASLPTEAMCSPELFVVPMRLVFDGRTYFDGRDLSPDEFYELLKKGRAPRNARYI